MSAQQMALPLAAPRPALVRVTVPPALTAARREQYRRLIARLVDWPPAGHAPEREQEG